MSTSNTSTPLDQNSFDPTYNTLPLAFFKPMLLQVFSRPANAMDILQPEIRVALRDEKVAEKRNALTC